MEIHGFAVFFLVNFTEQPVDIGDECSDDDQQGQQYPAAVKGSFTPVFEDEGLLSFVNFEGEF